MPPTSTQAAKTGRPHNDTDQHRKHVQAAAAEYHSGRDLKPNGPYLALQDRAKSGTAQTRAAIAEAIYLEWHFENLRGSRAMDDCFEMGDGDEVVTILTKRSAMNPKLHSAICKDYGGNFPASWIKAAPQMELFA